jgi:hypothetical protein
VFTVARRWPATFVVQSRKASSSHDHHDHQEDATVYPRESECIATFACLLSLIFVGIQRL